MSLIQFENVDFRYKKDSNFKLHLNKLLINKNSRYFVYGPSGCGKTTLLNIITGVVKPDSGYVSILDTEISHLSRVECDQFRANHFGIIFQLFNLIPYLSVIDNIILPCSFSKKKKKKALALSKSLEEEAQRLCYELGINDSLLQKNINQLSIGQQQRVAIARAIIGQPEIIIADEPTSALDNDAKEQFMAVLLRECTQYNTTLLFVSHDITLKDQFTHLCNLENINKPCVEKI